MEFGEDRRTKYVFYDKGQLLSACAKGDFEKVKELVARGALVNQKDIYDVTPLLYAVRSGNFEIVKFLIAGGALVNQKDRFGDTPLHDAVRSRNIEMVKFLIEHGANLEVENPRDKTPLDIAESLGEIKIERLLIEAGADVNRERSTLLYRAIKKNDIEMVKLLMKKGAPIKGYALTATIPDCSPDMLSVLLENGYGYPIDWDTLFKKVRSGTPELELIKKAALDRRAHIDWKDKLFSAVNSGTPELVELLIKAGADVNCVIEEEWGTSFTATGIDIFGELQGNESHFLRSEKQTPLSTAILRGDPKMVKLLLKAGASLNEKLSHGKTPMDLAERNPEIEKVLKEEQLRRAIKAMENYGELLQKKKDVTAKEKGTVAITLARELMKKANDFMSADTKLNEKDHSDFIPVLSENDYSDFINLLNSKDEIMKTHRAKWKPIVANILIAFTGIGLMLMAGSAISSVYNKKKISFNDNLFFSKPKLQQKSENIKEAIDLLRPGGKRK